MMQRSPAMGILLITWNFPPRRGGIENLVAGLCNQLRKKHPLFVITSFAPSAEDQEEWVFRPRWPGLLAFSLYALFRGFLLLHRNHGIKVILGGSAMVAPLALLLARTFRRKAVACVHGLDLIHSNVLYQWLCVRWLRHCDRVVANSRYTAFLAEGKKARADSIHVIPPAVDWEAFLPVQEEEVKREMGLAGRKILLFVGRLARRKGLSEFLRRSFAKIVSQVPEVCLLVVGENPTDSLVHHDNVLGEIRVVVQDMGLENHVRLLGWLAEADLNEIYQICDLMILPALSVRDDVEGFGIVILEAAAAGKPCVATRVGGIPDAIEDGKSGILIEPGDDELMSRAIVRLLRDEQARLVLGEYAQKRAREKFGWNSVVRKYEQLLESL